jgi:hypothetical protein
LPSQQHLIIFDSFIEAILHHIDDYFCQVHTYKEALQ